MLNLVPGAVGLVVHFIHFMFCSIKLGSIEGSLQLLSLSESSFSPYMIFSYRLLLICMLQIQTLKTFNVADQSFTMCEVALDYNSPVSLPPPHS